MLKSILEVMSRVGGEDRNTKMKEKNRLRVENKEKRRKCASHLKCS